jgi:YidC/Oxa1 family membrane protein insertase
VATGNSAETYTGFQIVMPVLSGEARHVFHVYLGPSEYDRLRSLGLGLEEGVNLGWKFFRPISHLLLTVMVWMYGFIPNYGVVIIIISSLTKVLFYPLTKSSFRSMKAMQQIQPHVKEVREKYKGDPKRMQVETMELYKKHKVNPVGGCLPMLLQMPVFIALYSVLANSITMRQAGFGLWIDDLSVPDTLFVIGAFPIHVLPVVMFVTTVAQQLLTPVQDPRQKLMGYMMPFVMLFIFYSFPAGLNLYWTVNNILTVAQQWKIHREIPSEPAAPEAPRDAKPKREKAKK